MGGEKREARTGTVRSMRLSVSERARKQHLSTAHDAAPPTIGGESGMR